MIPPTDTLARWAASYGSASFLALSAALAPCPTEANARAIEAAHRARYGERRLTAEREDEAARDAAAVDDAALVAYEQKWTKRLRALQRRFPARWSAPGLSAEELRDELALRLVEAVRTRPEERTRHARAGKEWGLVFLVHARRSVAAAFRLNVVLAEPEGAPDFGRGPRSAEELLLEEEDARGFVAARERAERGLSLPQRRWLSAMKLSANAGAFFEASGRLNLAAAARLLDKNRSSATRAWDELAEHFRRERRKLVR